MTELKQHCIHEKVCGLSARDFKRSDDDGTHCYAITCEYHSTDAQQRIEEVIGELEQLEKDAKKRSIRAHEIEDGKWCGANRCDAPDAELKTLKKIIALLREGVRKG